MLVWDIVVGDVLILSCGQKIPADCVVIDSFELQVHEDLKNKLEDESQKVNKGSLEKREDPFLYAGSIITQGSCKAVVCCVGEHSSRGIIDEKLDTESDTPLQKKLRNLSI